MAVAVLYELFGVAWIPAAVITAVGLLDTVTGGFLFYKLMDLLDLDCYTTLSEKYADKERDVFREERHYAYSQYRQYLHDMLVHREFKKAWQLRRAKADPEYLTLYNMEMAWDGDERAIQWLKKEWEE